MKKEVLLIELLQFEVFPKPKHSRAKWSGTKALCYCNAVENIILQIAISL